MLIWEQIAHCEALNTKVFVKRPKTKNATDNSSFSINKFKFIPEKNIYICPAGKHLTFSRNLRKRKSKDDKDSSIIGYEYSCSSCFDCPYFRKCTTSLAGRSITRNFYQDTLDIVQKRFDENPDVYTLRKCVVEHPFGTIKRSLGYIYFLRKGLESVNVEAALICLAYDFKRLINIDKIANIQKKMYSFFSLFAYIFSYFLYFSKKAHESFLIHEFFIYIFFSICRSVSLRVARLSYLFIFSPLRVFCFFMILF